LLFFLFSLFFLVFFAFFGFSISIFSKKKKKQMEQQVPLIESCPYCVRCGSRRPRATNTDPVCPQTYIDGGYYCGLYLERRVFVFGHLVPGIASRDLTPLSVAELTPHLATFLKTALTDEERECLAAALSL
jgi:hypothetical protein